MHYDIQVVYWFKYLGLSRFKQDAMQNFDKRAKDVL